MRRYRIWRLRRLKRVIVTLKPIAGAVTSFDGLLFDWDEDVIVLRNTTAIEQGPNGSNVGVDGELILLRNDVAFMQRP